MLKKLPIGIQTFSRIIEENYFYIDKTDEVLKVIDDALHLFLSRPRRFGKSLFLDTLRCAYEGKKELFKGLYLYHNYDFEEYPIIKKLPFKADELLKEPTDKYSLPRFTSSFQNQGLNYFTSKDNATILKNVISIPSNSDVYRAYFKSREFTVLYIDKKL